MTKAQYNEQLILEFDNKKNEWHDKIKDLAPLIRSKDPHDMTDAQALALSYRTMLNEEISTWLNELAGEQKTYKILKRDRFILYSTGFLPDGTRPTGNIANHPIIGHQKISGTQREMIISGDYADYEHTIELLENMINCMREHIKTIDQYMYAIKNRLDLFTIFK